MKVLVNRPRVLVKVQDLKEKKKKKSQGVKVQRGKFCNQRDVALPLKPGSGERGIFMESESACKFRRHG